MKSAWDLGGIGNQSFDRKTLAQGSKDQPRSHQTCSLCLARGQPVALEFERVWTLKSLQVWQTTGRLGLS